jgi:hypothetical protein
VQIHTRVLMLKSASDGDAAMASGILA